MSIRAQQPEVEQQRAIELDAALAATDSALRQLDVARGRERHLSEQVAVLEERLLEAETRLAEMQRSVVRASTLADDIQRTTSWRVTAPLRAVRRLLKRP